MTLADFRSESRHSLPRLRVLAPLLTALLALGCATPAPAPAPEESPPLSRDDSCRAGEVLLDAHFDGGQIGACTPGAAGDFELLLFPEDEPPINRSPWYAYRVSGRSGDTVTVRMAFRHGYARYWPKISNDGTTWQPLTEEQVVVDAEAEPPTMTLNFTLDSAQTWIAGQPLLTGPWYDEWLRQLEAHPELSTRMIGSSILGRPIYLAESADRPEGVLMFGRQHPPEVTGAISMRSFIETVLGDSELARSFRARFKLAIVPMVNPDGVALGHWRHNVGHKDVNRDWGPFTQPESQAVIRWLEAEEADGMKLQLMLDFHSTFEDLFYTQPKEQDPPDFASIWLEASAKRLPDFPFKHEANPVSDQPNAKNYFYKSRGIPAVTYESGDQTSRTDLERSAVVFAEEMMRTLLQVPAPPGS